jgi:D-arabinose 1-dehydrogenase-like Zn-dependent alcohol dehydrogenase
MTTMKAVQISYPGGDFELVERAVPTPGPGQVRIKVEACGVCHSDVAIKEGIFPWLQYPRIPGHEVVGTVDAVGDEVSGWRPGMRVGVGWHGGHCFVCEACREGDFMTCEAPQVTGILFDGGYAEYMVAPQEGLARVPDALSAAEAAPLLCAGITCFNALRHSGAKPGDVVAVQGVGGLGHLGVQYAKKSGFKTVAISNGSGKEQLAREFGADVYIDASTEDPAEALQRLGGAQVILATAPDGPSMSGLLSGLKRSGTLLVVGIGLEPLAVSTWDLIVARRSVLGWPNGTARDSEETMAFSVLQDVRPQIETFPLEEAAEAYRRMMANEVRFRAVLTVS